VDITLRAPKSGKGGHASTGQHLRSLVMALSRKAEAGTDKEDRADSLGDEARK
jgi:hypothetical protein